MDGWKRKKQSSVNTQSIIFTQILTVRKANKKHIRCVLRMLHQAPWRIDQSIYFFVRCASITPRLRSSVINSHVSGECQTDFRSIPRQKCSFTSHSSSSSNNDDDAQPFQPNKQIKIKSNSFSTLKNCIFFCVALLERERRRSLYP